MNELNKLTLKLRDCLYAKLMGDGYGIDAPYATICGETYSRRQLAAQIGLETEIGIALLTSLVQLAIDITERGNIANPEL